MFDHVFRNSHFMMIVLYTVENEPVLLSNIVFLWYTHVVKCCFIGCAIELEILCQYSSAGEWVQK